jgi:hypothetical protein
MHPPTVARVALKVARHSIPLTAGPIEKEVATSQSQAS